MKIPRSSNIQRSASRTNHQAHTDALPCDIKSVANELAKERPN
jgi:hypothetical protein